MWFSDQRLYHYSLFFLYVMAPPTILGSLFANSPYGKHSRPGGGATISPPLAWCVMESPMVWLTLLLFPHGRNSHNPRAYILISPLLVHYIHRTFIYPLRLFLKTRNQKIQKPGVPVEVAVAAFVYNSLNGYLQARWVSEYADLEGDAWFWLRFSGGAVVFVGGMAANIWSDNLLLGLKKESGGAYRVPKGGLFEWVSSPNYLGEILEWFGWAVMTWSWAGFGFFLYTCANLAPRARATHKWYLEKFGEDYPNSRKALIPFLY